MSFMLTQFWRQPACKTATALLALLLVSGCASFGISGQASRAERTDNNPPVVLPAKITAVGYGAVPTLDGLSNAQRRLLSMRAAKLDAYRALAETVAGLKITGNSTVSALALNNDGFRIYVEAYLRGARVVSVNPLPDGAYETTLELTLGGDFYRAAPVAAAVQENTSGTGGMTEVVPASPEPMKAVPQPVSVNMGNSRNYYLSL